MNKGVIILLLLVLCLAVNTKAIPTTGTFTPINTNLTLSDPYPSNGSTDTSLNITLTITCTSPQGHLMNLSWHENTTGSWVLQQTNSSHTANTSAVWGEYTNASVYSTTYWWSVNLTDGTDWTNETYHFTTESKPLGGGALPPSPEDSDGDGLSDEMEEIIGTDIHLPDTDFDGYTDYEEYLAGTDPLDYNDHPGMRCWLCIPFLFIPLILWIFVIIPAIIAFLVILLYYRQQKK